MKNKIILTLLAIPVIANASIEITNPEKQDYVPDQSYPKTLLNMRAPMFSAARENDPYDTDLHINLALMKIDHAFTPIFTNENIGYAVSGAWTDNGWTGINQYFRDPLLGTCDYESLRIYGLAIPKDKVRHDVRGQLSSYYTYGDDKNGYIYSLSWYDEQKDTTIINYTLKCAKQTQDTKMLTKLIKLANSL